MCSGHITTSGNNKQPNFLTEPIDVIFFRAYFRARAKLLTKPNINLDNGIINGLIQPEDIDDITEIIGLGPSNIKDTEFHNIDNCDHVYGSEHKTLDNHMEIYVGGNIYRFYKVSLTKHKGSDDIFSFIAQGTIKDLEVFMVYYLQ